MLFWFVQIVREKSLLFPSKASERFIRENGWVEAHPGFGAVHPGFGAVQPGFGAVHPGFGAVHPDFGAVHPWFGAVQPGFGMNDNYTKVYVVFT